MASHKVVSGFRITLGAGGLRFSKRPSGFNVCIRKQLKGQKHPGVGRASRTNSKGVAFTSAAQTCSK